MSDDYLKLVARVQHFYDVMITTLCDVQDAYIESKTDSKQDEERKKCLKLNELVSEYSDTFEEFLYK